MSTSKRQVSWVVVVLGVLACASVGCGQCNWSPVGTGAGNQLTGGGIVEGDLMVHDEDGVGGLPAALFAAGSLNVNAAGSVNLARWDGLAWTQVGGANFNASCYEMVSFDEDGPGGNPPALIVGGGFTVVTVGVNAQRIARWDGIAWSPVGGGCNAEVRSFAVFDEDGPGGAPPALFLGGTFTTAGGLAANLIARWDGTVFSAVGAGLGGGGGQCNALSVFDDGTGPALYALGSFNTAGGIPVNNIARWDGTAWTAVGNGVQGAGAPGRVSLVFDDGTGPALYCGGLLNQAGAVPVNNIARWDGTAWSAVGNGLVGGTVPLVSALEGFDDGSGPALYAGGTFNTIANGNIPANSMARWDGTSWTPLAGGLASTNMASIIAVNGLATFNDGNGPALFATGNFFVQGPPVIATVARWACTSTALSLSLTQPQGPGGLAYLSNNNLEPGAEYFNLFSVEPCLGPLGSGPYLGLCATTGAGIQFLVDQVSLPLGAPPIHFLAPETSTVWPGLNLPAITVDGLCVELRGGAITQTSPVVRLVVQ